MEVLVTGAATMLGQAVANELRQEHTVRLIDIVPVPTELEFLHSGNRVPCPNRHRWRLTLSELVYREFARAENITVVCLRLGETMREEERRNAVQAIRQALVMEPQRRRRRYRWWVSHVRGC